MQDAPDTADRWMTYAEIAELLGISTGAARQLARRHKWPRRTPNEYGAVARVLVPPDRIPPEPAAPVRDTAGIRTANGCDTASASVSLSRVAVEAETAPVSDTVGVRTRHVNGTAADGVQGDERNAVLRTMVDVLRTELSAAHERADRAERRAETAERRIEVLQEEQSKLTTLLGDERADHRQVVEALVARIPTRRSWLPWRR
jgi:hypothetical protein